MAISSPIPDGFTAIVLLGPTGIGKTRVSLAVAEALDCEIVSVDSMQVYRHMDIGTAKATLAERRGIPHHLIDIVDPDEEYHLARFVKDAGRACDEISGRGKIPLLVGGTGLYLKGLLEGVFVLPRIDARLKKELWQQLAEKGRDVLFAELLTIDPVTAARIHPNDYYRLVRALEIFQATGIPWSEHLAGQSEMARSRNVLKIGLTCAREELYRRINDRSVAMIEAGLLDEVRKLLAMGFAPDLPAMQAIGYRHMLGYLQGGWDWDQACFLLARDTRRYAKRQFTWFQKDKGIHWYHPSQGQEIIDLCTVFVRNGS